MDLWGAITWFVTLPGLQAIVLIVAAIATAGSVIVALVISRRAEYHQSTRDRIESDARLERRAERQAVLVRVEVIPVRDNAGSRDDEGVWHYVVRVHNASSRSIRWVSAYLMVTKLAELYKDRTPIPAGGPCNEIEPDSFFDFAVSRKVDDEQWDESAKCDFQDAFGDAWEVGSQGNLTLLMERDISRDIRGH